MNRAFTLIELIITLFISSLIILIFAMLFDFSTKTNENINKNDKSDMALMVASYLTDEIQSSKIYDGAYKKAYFPYDKSLGIILQSKRLEGQDGKAYNYSYFALRNDEIYRIAINTDEGNINSNKVEFIESADTNIKKGVNSLVGGVEDAKINYNRDTGLVDISLKFFNDPKTYRTSVYAYGGEI